MHHLIIVALSTRLTSLRKTNKQINNKEISEKGEKEGRCCCKIYNHATIWEWVTVRTVHEPGNISLTITIKGVVKVMSVRAVRKTL